MAMFSFFSLPAVLIACFINMMTGALWYSPALFGTQFLLLAFPKRKPEDVKPDNVAMLSATIGTLMSMPFFCFLLSVAGVRTAGEGALWGAALSLFFDSGMNAAHGFFENRPFALFVLHRGGHAISLMSVGLVLGALCGSG